MLLVVVLTHQSPVGTALIHVEPLRRLGAVDALPSEGTVCAGAISTALTGLFALHQCANVDIAFDGSSHKDYSTPKMGAPGRIRTYKSSASEAGALSVWPLRRALGLVDAHDQVTQPIGSSQAYRAAPEATVGL